MMMMMVCASPGILEADRIASVVVVDPRFDAYKGLAASARQGRLQLHFRSSGAEALKLAQRLDVDAWLVAADLDDMSGPDLVALLDRDRAGETKLIAVGAAGASTQATGSGPAEKTAIDAVLSHPVALADIESVLGVPAGFLALRNGPRVDRQGLFAGAGSAPVRSPRPAGVPHPTARSDAAS